MHPRQHQPRHATGFKRHSIQWRPGDMTAVLCTGKRGTLSTGLKFPAQAEVFAAMAPCANVGSEDDARPYAPGPLWLASAGVAANLL